MKENMKKNLAVVSTNDLMLTRFFSIINLV